jgi:integrase/recombinase XerD
MLIREAIGDFLQFCSVERRLSENTIRAYASDLADFHKLQGAEARSGDVCNGKLKAYLRTMVAERKLASSTVRRRMACLRMFFRYLTDAQSMVSPFAGWKVSLPRHKLLPRALSREEIACLLTSTQDHDGKANAQLITAMRVMVCTGIRVGELCKLRVEDVSPDGGTLRIHGKGSRDRTTYVADAELQTALRRLLVCRSRCMGRSAHLFLNRHGSKLKPRSIRLSLHRAAAAAGLTRRVTPHMLRHTAATLLIETGVDIRIVQRLLGHASIATTEIYTHVSDEALRSTLKRADILCGLQLASSTLRSNHVVV